MRLLPPDVPVTEPFFAALRRRHPDVDLLLLPPEARAPEQPHAIDLGGDLSDADVATLRADLAELLVRLWPDAGAAPTTLLRHGSLETTVRAEARLAGRPVDPGAVAADLRAGLVAAGVRGRVTHAPTTGLVVATLSSADIVVGVARARALVRAGGR